MSRPMILVGCWPRRMSAELAATYCGEPSTEAFLKRVGKDYPQPRVNEGRRRLWLRDDLDQRFTVGAANGARRGRGFVTVTLLLPRFVIAKRLASWSHGFLFSSPEKYRDLGCTVISTRSARLRPGLRRRWQWWPCSGVKCAFDEWEALRRGLSVSGERAPIYGTIRWLFQEYRRSKAYLEKVRPRSRPDYERTMQLIEDIVTKKGDRLGDRQIRSMTPVSTDMIYEIILSGPDGNRPRQAEKAWRFPGAPGASSTDYILRNLIGMCRIPGTV